MNRREVTDAEWENTECERTDLDGPWDATYRASAATVAEAAEAAWDQAYDDGWNVSNVAYPCDVGQLVPGFEDANEPCELVLYLRG